MLGLSVLDDLRPPDGFETTAALGTSYSLDLVAALLAISSLDGVQYDGKRNPGYIRSLRAVERLKSKVLILVQQGRIYWPKNADSKLFSLLDRIVVPVQVDASQHSFHPKVWVSRQRNVTQGTLRYVLSVGSRNLTGDNSWDMGVTLVGNLKREREVYTTRLDSLSAFVDHALSLVSRSDRAKLFPELEDVRWELPTGTTKIEFGFQPGARETALENATPFQIKKPVRVLVLSPFLDAAGVKEAASTWKELQSRNIRLVAGTQDLDKVACTKSRSDLITLNPLQIAAHDPDRLRCEDNESDDNEQDESTSELEEPGERGLHAKVYVAWREQGDAVAVIGSPNLTKRAWGGPNCEAFLTLTMHGELAEQVLWNWAEENGHLYDPPVQPPKKDKETDDQNRLESLRNALSSRSFHLSNEVPRTIAELSVKESLPWASMNGVKLSVRRLSQDLAAPSIEWKAGKSIVELPSCDEADETTFIVFELKLGTGSIAWVQVVTCDRMPDDRRDRLLLVKKCGLAGFLEYFNSLLGQEYDDGETPGPGDERLTSGNDKPAGRINSDLLNLEQLLSRIARKTDELSTLSATARSFAEIFKRRDIDLKISLAERQEFERFMRTWRAIEEGFK